MTASPLVCVTVTAPTLAELRARRDRAAARADLVELRLDTVRDPDVAGALADRSVPVVVTCRPSWEGGEFRGAEEDRKRLLAEALALGAEYVDVEWRARFSQALIAIDPTRVVLSMHDFDALPADLAERARAMQTAGAAIVKIAVKANRLSDCLPLLEIGARAAPGIVLLAMGARGLASRVLAHRFRSTWTYAGSLGAIGQLTADALLDEYRFRTIGGETAVYGLAGSSIAHSVSPAMHNAAFREAGLDAVYLPCDAADADDFLTFARAIGLRGASVTIPFKVPLFERADETCDVARRIGALNTIRFAHGRLLGTNTDVSGFLAPLVARRVDLSGKRAAILGAGGAARAVALALSQQGADVTVHARNRAQALEVASIASGTPGAWPPEAGGWDLLVNTTPIGMHPDVDRTPIARERLTGGLVYDLVYNPPETRLLREAASAGCRTIGGLDMLVAQAQEQLRWWTGRRPPAEVMRAAALKRLSEFSSHEDYVV